MYQKLGRGDDSVKAREEATQLNPALAAQAASAELAAQEELELTLSPETDSDLGDVGIDLGAPDVAEEVALPPAAPEPVPVEAELDIAVDDVPLVVDDDDADAEPEIDISLEESQVEVSVDIEEEIPVEVDLGAADVDIASSADVDLGGVAGFGEPEAVPVVEDIPEVEDIPISVDEDLPIDAGAAAEEPEISLDGLGGAEGAEIENRSGRIVRRHSVRRCQRCRRRRSGAGRGRGYPGRDRGPRGRARHLHRFRGRGVLGLD